jgi:hypothetical protein
VFAVAHLPPSDGLATGEGSSKVLSKNSRL